MSPAARWTLTSRLAAAYVAAGGGADGYAAATAALETYILTDRKISRLTEQLKDAVVDGGLDDVESIRELFRDIYKQSTLAGVDEEGNLRAV
jgi:hypothetical protein